MSINPRAYFKKEVVTAITSFVYNTAEKTFQKELDNIIVRNSALHNSVEMWLRFDGELFIHSEAPTHTSWKVPLTHHSLRASMAALLRDKTEWERECSKAMGYLIPLWNASNSLDDYCKVLPDSLHRALLPLAVLSVEPPHLNPDQVIKLQLRIQPGIDMLRSRLMLNLISG